MQWRWGFIVSREDFMRKTARKTVRHESFDQAVARRKRQLLIEPNKDSDLKIEIYEFGLTKKVTLGVPAQFRMTNSPDVTFRISKMIANVTQPGMFYIRDIRVANVGCTIGGSLDAFNLKDLRYDYPTLTPANRVSVQVEYTGLVPDCLKAMPIATLTAEHVIAGVEEALEERDDRVLRERLKELINRGPLFEFAIGASGYATIVA